MSLVRHDGFARYELHKHPCPFKTECAWCGRPSGIRPLYNYSIRPDDNLSGSRTSKEREAFCNLSCRASYRGE